MKITYILFPIVAVLIALSFRIKPAVDEKGEFPPIASASFLDNLPILGSTLGWILNPSDFFVRNNLKLGGIYRGTVLGEDFLFITGQDVAAFYDESYIERERAQPAFILKVFPGRHVAQLDHKEHRQRKGLLMSAVTPAQLERFAQFADQYAVRFLKEYNGKPDVSLVELFAAWANTVAFRSFTGIEIDSRDPIWSANEAAIAGTKGIPIDLPFTPFGKAVRAIDSSLVPYYKNMSINARAGKSEAHSGVSEILRMAKEQGIDLNDEIIAQEFNHLMLAGGGVAGSFGMNTVFNVARHPSILEQLRKVTSKAPEKLSIANFETGDLQYVRNVVLESMRYTPNLLGAFGKVVKTTQVKAHTPSGEKTYTLPAGFKVILGPAGAHKDPAVWPNPNTYDPSRWVDQTFQNTDSNFKFIAMGGGRASEHKCLGYRMAPLITQVIVTRLFQHCTFEIADPSEVVDASMPVPIPGSGLHVKNFQCKF